MEGPGWNGYVSLKTSAGTFVGAQPDGFITADAKSTSIWEVFTMITHVDGLVSFRSENGQYMSTEHYGSVRAQAWNVGTSESFRLEVHGGGRVALRCSNDRYLRTVDACHLSRVQRSCFKRGHAFSSLDLSEQPMTREASAPACQARCRASGGCRHFTFSMMFGYCYLASSHVRLVTNNPGTIAGPNDCDGPSYVVLQAEQRPQNHLQILPKAGMSRVEIGPLDGKLLFCIFTLAILPTALLLVVARWHHDRHPCYGQWYSTALLLQAGISDETLD